MLDKFCVEQNNDLLLRWNTGQQTSNHLTQKIKQTQISINNKIKHRDSLAFSCFSRHTIHPEIIVLKTLNIRQISPECMVTSLVPHICLRSGLYIDTSKLNVFMFSFTCV